MNDVETHITLVTEIEWPTFASEASELCPDDVGYLIHSEHGVHGVVRWPDQRPPYYLLTPNLKPMVAIAFSSLPAVGESEAPYSWQEGRGHLVRIASFNISCASECETLGSSD